MAHSYSQTSQPQCAAQNGVASQRRTTRQQAVARQQAAVIRAQLLRHRSPGILPLMGNSPVALPESPVALPESPVALPEGSVDRAAVSEGLWVTPDTEATSAVNEVLAKRDQLEALSRAIRCIELSGRTTKAACSVISSGCALMDACLPEQGYSPGTIVEYLRTTPACGATFLALATAASALRSHKGFLVVVDTERNIYPPALVNQSIDLGRTIFVHPDSQADAIWAVDQSLRNPAVAAVISHLDRLDDRSARRLQLAAEQGGGLGIMVRSSASRYLPSWAEVQWLVRGCTVTSQDRANEVDRGWIERVRPQNRPLQLRLIRSRGGKVGSTLAVEIEVSSGRLVTARALSSLATEWKRPEMVQVKQHESYPVIERERNRHEHVPSIAVSRDHVAASTAEEAVAVPMASQLAHPTNSGRRTAVG